MDLATWQQDSEVFKWQNWNLFVKDTASKNKPVLLCIHGFPTASIDWRPIWPQLCEKFRCITLDLLGFGLSDKPKKQPITLMSQADICIALMASKGVGEFHILCHDYGVSVAQEMLARAKETKSFKPLSCIYLNGGLYHGVHKPELIQKLLMSPIGPLVAKLTSFSRFSATMNKICTQPLSPDELNLYWRLLTRDGGRELLPELIKYMRERKLHAQRWGKATDNPICPARLINGVDDPISGGHLADAYQQRVSNADVVRLDNTGHYPQVESPDKVLAACLTFWNVNNVH